MGEHTDKAKGKIKQVVGKALDDDKLVREGKRDELKGDLKGAAKDVKEAVKDAGAAIKRSTD